MNLPIIYCVRYGSQNTLRWSSKLSMHCILGRHRSIVFLKLKWICVTCEISTCWTEWLYACVWMWLNIVCKCDWMLVCKCGWMLVCKYGWMSVYVWLFVLCISCVWIFIYDGILTSLYIGIFFCGWRVVYVWLSCASRFMYEWISVCGATFVRGWFVCLECMYVYKMFGLV